MLRDLRVITIRKEYLPDRKALHPDEKLFESVRQSIVPVYNNLWEMSTTGLLHNDVKIIKVRDAIRRIMLCQERMILIEPLRYLVVIGNKKYKYQERS